MSNQCLRIEENYTEIVPDAILGESTSPTNGIIFPRERDELLQAIKYLRALDDDWNGFDAKKITHVVFSMLERFINSVPLNLLYPNSVSPDGEGGALLKWASVNGERLLVSFEPGLLHVSHRINGKDTFVDNIIYGAEDGRRIPEQILSRMPLRKKTT